MKRAEVRIIKMTEKEYNRAMKQFLGGDYWERKDSYCQSATHIPDFANDLEGCMEVAEADELHTQYMAWIVEDDGSIMRRRKDNGKATIPLNELPESFDPEKFEFDNLFINLDNEE